MIHSYGAVICCSHAVVCQWWLLSESCSYARYFTYITETMGWRGHQLTRDAILLFRKQYIPLKPRNTLILAYRPVRLSGGQAPASSTFCHTCRQSQPWQRNLSRHLQPEKEHQRWTAASWPPRISITTASENSGRCQTETEQRAHQHHTTTVNAADRALEIDVQHR